MSDSADPAPEAAATAMTPDAAAPARPTGASGPGRTARPHRPDRREPDAEQRAESLKERIYITFSALAIVMTLETHSDENGAASAALTLLIGVVGTLLAVFLADFLSHLTVHAHVPTGPEFRHMVAVSLGAIGVIVVPMILIGIAALGWWSLAVALGGCVGILLATLIVVGYLAVRRIRLPVWQKVVILLAETAVGAAVIGLELLAHH